jgi:hypothetical protein
MLVGNLSPKLPWDLANPRWASQINPLFGIVEGLTSQPLLQGYQISGIVLAATTPLTINHTLGVVPAGWFLVDINASAAVWRVSWTPYQITLEASAAATVSIWIY